MYLEYVLRNEEPAVSVNVYLLEKPATRMSEALWLTFHPLISDQGRWIMDKSGEALSPQDVVAGGSRGMHAVRNHCLCHDRDESLVVETLDSPLFAVGEKSALNFSRALPDLSRGVHCSLYNNAWGRTTSCGSARTCAPVSGCGWKANAATPPTGVVLSGLTDRRDRNQEA